MTPLPFGQRGAWSRYTTADGLAAQQTEHLVEDGDGYLWIATVTGGLSRFDGDEFRTYTTRDGLPADGVSSLLVDRRGQLWCGTSRGLCLFDGTCFHPFAGDGEVAGDWVTFLFEDRRGWVWLKGFKACGYWDGECYCDLAPRIRALTNSEFGSCWGICEDQAGAIWMGGNRHTIRWTDGAVETVALPQGPQKEQGWEPCLAAHPEGGVWHSDGNRIGIWREGCYTAVEVSIKGFVRKILPGRQGHTWFCLFGGEHTALVCEGGCFRGLSGLEIGFSSVCGFHEDREGSLWFATWGGGVTRFDPSGPFTLGAAEGLPSPHLARVVPGQGRRLWVAFADLYLSGSTVGYLQDGHFCPVVQHGEGGLLARTDGSVLLAGVWGLRRRRDDFLETEYLVTQDSIRPALGNGTFTCLAEEGGQVVLGWRCGRWPQTELGISRYDGAAVQELFAMAAPDIFSAVVDLVPTADGLWFGIGAYYGQGPGYGLGFLNGDGAVSWYLPADGLVHASVQALHVDRAGHLWVATLGGVSRFDGHAFSNYTIDSGLPHNHVRSIAEDGKGGLWFGTDAGVARFEGETFQLLRWGSGSPIRSMARDSTGQWWFATMEGLVGYRPSAVAPRVRMVQTLADRVYRGSEAVEVNTSMRQLVFEYKGMSFRTRAEDMLYRCRLLGHEEGWRPATHERRAFYRDLPPGEYTFQVCAIDRDLNESAPAGVRLKVVPDERDQRIDELTRLTAALNSNGVAGEFLGESQALGQALAQLRQVAPTAATVLIQGETGTGKGLAARVVHKLSSRRAGPFLQVNCGAIPSGLFESEFFGHERGAFTGATSRKLGKIELAAGGTLFLDEIGDLALEAQVKLLRVLEEGSFERVGGAQTLQAEVRVIAASNRDLRQMTKDGRFREDLYFRLQTFPVRLPPLRERREDIPILATFFAERMAAHLNKTITQLEPAVLDLLKKYDWPGNVRELEHAIQRAVIVCAGQAIQVVDIAVEVEAVERLPTWERVTLEENERRYLRQVLEQSGWVIGGPEGAATVLGVPESTLRYRMKKLGLKRPWSGREYWSTPPIFAVLNLCSQLIES